MTKDNDNNRYKQTSALDQRHWNKQTFSQSCNLSKFTYAQQINANIEARTKSQNPFIQSNFL